jgi:3-carboxy-cis,cis-muconate cycloisomerase
MSEALLSPVWAGTAAAISTSDAEYLTAMLDSEVGLARVSATAGLIPGKAAEAIAVACTKPFDTNGIVSRAVAHGNPVIPMVEELRAAVEPHAADWVHFGVTSQDILDTATMLVAARTLDLIGADLTIAASHAARLAETHRDTVMAGRTLTQHAVPITFGLKAAGWLAAIMDATRRLGTVRSGLPVQLGGAAGTLATFGDHGLSVLHAFAAEVGLAVPLLPWHTRRTPIADVAAALAIAAGLLGKIATDVAMLAHTEIGELSEGSPGGSSTMPHKRNPVRATLIRSAATQAPHLAAMLLATMVGEHERPAGAWHAEWQPLRDLLRLTGGAAAHAVALLANLQVDGEAMRENTIRSNGLLVAERLAAALAPALGRQAARQLVSDRSRETGPATLRQLLAREHLVTSVLDAPTLDRLCDPVNYLGSSGVFVDRVLSTRRNT